MAANSIALKHWKRIITRWPVDKIRPEAVSFQSLMKKRLEKYENPAKAAEAAKVKGNEANVQPVDLTWNENKEMKQVNALYSLLENRFERQNTLPDSLRYPESNKTHYDDVIRESEQAPSRGLFTNLANTMRGMFRLW